MRDQLIPRAILVALATLVTPALSAPADPAAAPMRYVAPDRPGPIELVLRREGSRLVLLDAGHPAVAAEVAATTGVVIGGPDRHDTSLTIDYAYGPIPIPVDYEPGQLGPGTDNALTLQGASFQTESHLARDAHSGVITLDGIPIRYSNLTPLDDTVPAASFTFTAPAAAGTINVVDGPVVGPFHTTQINSSTSAFELLNFANKTSVTIDAQTAGSPVAIDNPHPAAGLATLIVRANGVTQSGPLVVSNLGIVSDFEVVLRNAGNVVDHVSMAISASGPIVQFASNVPDLSVTLVGGINGITTAVARVILENKQAGGAISVLSPISAGGVSLQADNLVIGADVGFNAVVVPETLDRPITLGTRPGTSLGLLQADLPHFTGGSLIVGSSFFTGNISVTAPITAPPGLSLLALITGGGTVTQTSPLSFPEVTASGWDVLLTDPGNAIGQFSGNVPHGAVHHMSLVTNVPNLTIDFSGVSQFGISTNGAYVTLENRQPGGAITIQRGVSVPSGISLQADNVVINADVSGNVTLFPESPSRPMTLGTKPGTSLGILQAEVSHLTGGFLALGQSSFTGGLTVAAPISAPGTRMSVRQPGLTGSGTGSLTVEHLVIDYLSSTTATTYNASPTSLQINALAAVPISVSDLEISSGSGVDTFNITPGPGISYLLRGWTPNPPALPGDTLSVNTSGQQSWTLTKTLDGGGYSGTYAFSFGAGPIQFQQMETLLPADSSLQQIPGLDWRGLLVLTLALGASGLFILRGLSAGRA